MVLSICIFLLFEKAFHFKIFYKNGLYLIKIKKNEKVKNNKGIRI